MSIFPEYGGAWGCRINLHRHNWNGTICYDPTNWNCGGTLNFREEYCNTNDPRCYALNTFAEENPYFSLDPNAGWLLKDNTNILDDQLIFFYTWKRGTFGKLETGKEKYTLAGIYIVDHVEPMPLPYKTIYNVFPKKNGMSLLIDLNVRLPRYRQLDRPFMVHFDRRAVAAMIQSIKLKLQAKKEPLTATQEEFFANLERHLKISSEKNDKLRQQQLKLSERSLKKENSTLSYNPLQTVLSNIKGRIPTPEELQKEKENQEKKKVEPKEVALEKKEKLEPLCDFETLKEKAAPYGKDLLMALWLNGCLPNSLTILRGSPGIGKSRFAVDLIPTDRHHIVSVASTWRGREDLLGYVSPITGEFQPSSFCNFLLKAEQKWREGDRKPFLVIFEEFNLSPPEFWFSDIMVRSQYPIDREAERTIELGGKPPKEWPQKEGNASVWLSPAIRFIATINTDHTTQNLSPRILDRATLIQMELSPKQICDFVHLELDNIQLEAIEALHDQLYHRGAGFSIRTANNILKGIEETQNMDISSWEIIDIVLSTQLLSKIRLFVGEPADMELLEEIDKWAEEHGAHLPRCVARFERWKEQLEAGIDVVQA